MKINASPSDSPPQVGNQDLSAQGLVSGLQFQDDVLTVEIIRVSNDLSGVQANTDYNRLVGVIMMVSWEAVWRSMAHKRPRRALEKASINPSSTEFISKPLWLATC